MKNYHIVACWDCDNFCSFSLSLFYYKLIYVDIYYRMVGGTTTFFRHVTATQDRNRNPRIQLILQFGFGGLGLFFAIIWMKLTSSTPPFEKSLFKSQEDPRIPDIKFFLSKVHFLMALKGPQNVVFFASLSYSEKHVNRVSEIQ